MVRKVHFPIEDSDPLALGGRNHSEPKGWEHTPDGTVFKCKKCKRTWIHTGDDNYPFVLARRLRNLFPSFCRRTLGIIGPPRACTGKPLVVQHLMGHLLPPRESLASGTVIRCQRCKRT